MIRHRQATLADVRLHFVEAGAGDPVILLHGWPQTWRAWRRIIPLLASDVRVIAPDLRGCGDSSRPAFGYGKRTLATDVLALCDQLIVDRCVVVGHDMGAAVGFAMAAMAPSRVRGLLVLETLMPGYEPSPANVDHLSGGFRTRSWHAIPDLPEQLIQGREQVYVDWHLDQGLYDPTAIDADVRRAYGDAWRSPGGLRAALALHRAAETDRADVALWAKTPLPMPVRAVGGAASLGPHVGAALQALAQSVSSEIIDDAGHWLPEERPDRVAAAIKALIEDIRDSGD